MKKTEFIEGLANHYKVNNGWSDNLATITATQAFTFVSLRWGGTREHIPTPKPDHNLIRDEWTAGITIAELGRRHGISQTAIREILKK